MSDTTTTPLAGVRHLRQQLRDLASVEAPSSLLAGILTTAGIADRYFTLDTPLGVTYIAYNDHGLSAVRRPDSAAEFERSFRQHFGRAVYPATEPPEELVNELRRELRGEGRARIRFDLRGVSEFERAVLLKALEIPRGEVRPYTWIAREIGNPRAVRAVGTALGNNPIPIFIPCHRVIRSDGQTGQYGLGGPEAKRTMLSAEGIKLDTLEQLNSEGVRFIGSDTTHAFCFPTCHHARRISPAHRVYFRSEAAALAAGYRPCKVCRPAVGA
jgi:O-6-methylguanine DNA methyltransferase